MRRFQFLLLLPLLAGLGGCNFVVLDPSGHIAAEQRDLLIFATGLMLLIILPVMGLTVYFAWRYRHTNTEAEYDPEWHHSTVLELVVWAAPLAIIICLGAVTYLGTHLLDPYRPLTQVDRDRPLPEGTEPLQVEVVSLDWKWLFFYPQYGIATVNELAAPVDRPIHFKITSSGVMNAFYIPALAGMIYSMAGMETQLHAVINAEGDYEGFSSNYSGAGFSGMRFVFKGLDQAGFEEWIDAGRNADEALTAARYVELEKPSENVPVMRFSSVEDGLYNRILEMCVDPGTRCMSETMALDAQTAAGGREVALALCRSPFAIFNNDEAVVGRAKMTPIPATAETRLRGFSLATPSSDVRLTDARTDDDISNF
ncbi:ubiquinol oxidase subunit II [Acuticoccus sp. M5D2P5]|uniref:ubiquinol oxidase subunit II n=1 Tax=Acuticoccus kalidii TaxID=2910977 RepID=UPI001F1BB2F4|nr:ubiquinol oxidase subunit II [Acuticoccus kalidii]MCF3936604.1 ubiquinol oxidase subunit II [Acuticoccus kalidii]